MTQPALDTLGDEIIAKGLAANSFLLDLNSALSVSRDFPLAAPWNLPSRMFRFPIEVSKPHGDQPRKLGLRHPMLKAHPFVQHVESVLGIEIDLHGAPNRCGYSSAPSARWHHAVDLISAGLWRELIDTQDFTDPACIFGAIAYGCRYSSHDAKVREGHITTAQARILMDELGACEPDSRSDTIRSFSAPSLCKQDSGAEHWPINEGSKICEEDKAWAFIHGIEDGWFAHDRSGFLQWTQLGRDRYAAGEAASYTETSGQAAFAF